MSRHKGYPTPHRASMAASRYRVWFVAIMITVASALIIAGKASATDWQQPYGGCAEGWQAPQSTGAAECRTHGWTIRPHFTIDPHNRVRATDLRPCRQEDQDRGCYWNAQRHGNGYGESFIRSFRGERFAVTFAWGHR